MTSPTPPSHPQQPTSRRILGVPAILFGIATLFAGGRTLFGSETVREQAGNIVPFVLIFNFLAAPFYIVTGLFTLSANNFCIAVARSLAIANVVIFAALGIHILMGGAFETRTVAAMTLRSTFWIVQAILLPKALKPNAG